MTAKEFLKQYGECERRIASRLRRIRALKEQAVSITRTLSERVQTSGSGDRHAEIIDSYLDMERALAADVERFKAIQAAVCLAIDTLEDSLQRDVLERYYIEGMTLEETAADLHYCYMQVCRIHGKALEKLAGTMA